MNLLPRKIVCFALALLATLPAVFLSAASQRTYSSDKFELTIDGVTYDNARGWEGSDMVADVVTENATGAGVQKKHVTKVSFSPLRVEFSLVNTPGMLALMNDLLENRPALHTMTLTEMDFSGKAVTSTEFFNATVSALELSAYDGSSKAPAIITLVFQSEQVRKSKSPAAVTAKGGAKQSAALAANFQFDLDGMACKRIGSVSALSVQRAAPTDAVGLYREGSSVSANVSYANLILKISAADLASWQDWADNFFVQGHRLDADEKNGSLTQLGPDLKTAIFTIQFSHVGLVRFSESDDTNTSAARRFAVELYYESASVSDPGAKDKAKIGSQQPSAPDKPAAATSNAAADPTAKPDASTTPTADSSSVPASTPPPADTPVAKTDVAPGTKTTAPVAAARATGVAGGSAADPTDEGMRDPREFMRIDGLVRKSYRSVDEEAYSSETVTYASKNAIDAVLAKYEAALKNAGWEEVRKDESGSAADSSHYYHLRWKKTVQEADLRFIQSKSGGTELTIAVDTRRAGILSGLAAALKGAGVDPAAAEGSPNDQGARDPADFPRIGRSTRRSYSATGSAKAPNEDVVYRAKVAIAAVEAFYVNQLNQADWEQSVRREGGDPLGATHDITLNWSRGKRTVKIYLKEIEPAITEITLSLYTSGN